MKTLNPVSGPLCQTPNGPPRTPAIPDALRQLHESVETLGGSVGELSKAIAPVVRTEPVEACDSGKNPTTGVDIADQILAANNRVRNMNDFLQDLMRRIEL